MSVLRADARNLPLPDASVDLIVTSPPFWALRSYTDGGEHYAGQIGAEPTPREYVDSLIACTREWVRVLKPAGSLWINLGDKYSQRPGQYPSGNAGASPALGGGARNADHIAARRGRAYTDMQPKSLIGLPWRYALRAIDELGLILRAEVIWSKPNGLPESVTDRVRRSHETWFHMTLSSRYYSAVDEIRQPHSPDSVRIARQLVGGRSTHIGAPERRDFDRTTRNINALGALPGSVWTIPTEPLRVPEWLGVDHFAAFPLEWPRRIIQGWSPSGICTACGEGRRPVAEKGEPVPHQASHAAGYVMPRHNPTSKHGYGAHSLGWSQRYDVTGYVCACPDTSAPTRPSVVLDPFGGTGTTALAARALGRVGISVDMSADYCRLAKWRTNDRGELARAMRVPKPEPVAEDQMALELVMA